MSQSATPTGNQDIAGLHCNNCGQFRQFQKCKSDKNGNKGVLFATCHGVNSRGERCSFVRRASKSPSASPSLPSTSIFHDHPPVAPALITQVAEKCSIHSCGQTRLADDCPRRVCRKHCIEQGGCPSKKHKASTMTGATTFTPQPLSVPQPPSTSILLTSRQPLPSVPTTYRSPSPEVDARADPRFSSHLHPIFTAVVAEQQEKSRQQMMVDAEQKEKAQKAKQRIAVYPWTAENSAPTVKFFQEFTWPYLTITPTLLAAVGLLEASEQGNLRMFDEMEVLDWVAIDVGYVIEVREGQRLFLKDASIRRCADFQKSLDTRPNCTPHLHRRLPHERAYVREMLKTISSPQQPTPPSASSSSSSRQQSIYYPQPTTPVSDINSTPSPSPSPVAASSWSPPPQTQPPFTGDTGGEKRWPTDYYTIDIGKCMRECNSRTHRVQQRERNQQTVFREYFPNVRFIPSTFSEQRGLWNNTPGSLRDEFMELGQCKEGLWAVFARRARREKKAKAQLGDIFEID
ncbi:hypothetical protein BYT27DRAFT_7082951 [Phlegmacium glaucopus]|nr:hypothetical protein BYT27DRAFT_7082951 [Phlegmacium glaucopus]